MRKEEVPPCQGDEKRRERMNVFLRFMAVVLAFCFYIFSLCLAILYWIGKQIWQGITGILEKG